MNKINIKVCPICKSEKCGGRMFKTPDHMGSYGFHVGIEIVCESDENVWKESGKWFYKSIYGHGDYEIFELTEITWDEAQNIIEKNKERQKLEIEKMRKENYGVVRAVKKICKNCKYFSQDYEADETGLNKNLVKHGWGDCFNKLFFDASDRGRVESGCLFQIWDFESYMANFIVHENFGCIGWEKC